MRLHSFGYRAAVRFHGDLAPATVARADASEELMARDEIYTRRVGAKRLVLGVLTTVSALRTRITVRSGSANA